VVGEVDLGEIRQLRARQPRLGGEEALIHRALGKTPHPGDERVLVVRPDGPHQELRELGAGA
jgi:hypothetical protein